MAVKKRSEPPQKREDSHEHGRKRGPKALEGPRFPDSVDLSHDQAQVESGGVDDQPLEDIVVTADVDPAHSAGVEHVREGPFDQ
ncbi:hypothetical protein SAMN02745121_08984, partial [Nannocystis exedens]